MDLLRSGPPLTRAQVARRTGLPSPTVVSAVARLVARHELVEVDSAEAPRGRGRPARALTPAHSTGDAVTVALTRRRMTVALVNLDGTIKASATRPFDANEAVEGFASDAFTLLEQALAEAGHSRLPPLIGAAVGVPAPLQAARRTSQSRRVISPVLKWGRRGQHLPGWLSQDPTRELSAALGVPCLAENDANLAALGEAAFGAAREFESFLYVKFIHGLGAGVVIDRRLVRGAHGFAGELAHLHVDDDGPVCMCGRRGCLSVSAGARRLVELARPTYGDRVTFDELLELTGAGEDGVSLLFIDLGRALGAALSPMCVLINPEAIIIDAELGPAAPAVVAGVQSAIAQHVPAPIARATRVLAGELGDRAETLGAAALIASDDGEFRVVAHTSRKLPAP